MKPNQRHCDFAALARTVSGTFALGNSSLHGPSHWRRVERNGIWLAERSGGDLFVVRLFAWFHDSCRVNDWTDPDHGKRGADCALKLRGTLFDLEDDALDRLVFACTWHTDKDHSDDPTIGACWDADRLDLGRVGMTPLPRFMSTAAGKEAAGGTLEHVAAEGDPSIEAASDRLRLCNSATRLPALIDYLETSGALWDAPKAWSIFHNQWCSCDETWSHRERLMEIIGEMRESVVPVDYLDPRDRNAFDALPKFIRIYRGCSVGRIYGFAWTTDLKVAEGFARGHRGITVPDPVIASVRIPKSAALGYYTERQESEVLVDPSDLEPRTISVRAFWG